ncbi:hypothetical protein BDW69DRAFT_11598 [Aspergillus filifer]
MEVVHCADHNLLTRYEHKGSMSSTSKLCPMKSVLNPSRLVPGFELRFGIIDEITVACNRTTKVCQPTAVSQSLNKACISLTRGYPVYLPWWTLIIVSFTMRSTSNRGTCLSASAGSDHTINRPTWERLTFCIDITTSVSRSSYQQQRIHGCTHDDSAASLSPLSETSSVD